MKIDPFKVVLHIETHHDLARLAAFFATGSENDDVIAEGGPQPIPAPNPMPDLKRPKENPRSQIELCDVDIFPPDYRPPSGYCMIYALGPQSVWAWYVAKHYGFAEGYGWRIRDPNVLSGYANDHITPKIVWGWTPIPRRLRGMIYDGKPT